MEKVKKGADRPENRHTGGGPDDGGRGADLCDQYWGAAFGERGGDQPCGGYDPEDLQCLRDPAEPYFLDRVVYHRDGIRGDYDDFDDVEALIEFIRTGKR